MKKIGQSGGADRVAGSLSAAREGGSELVLWASSLFGHRLAGGTLSPPPHHLPRVDLGKGSPLRGQAGAFYPRHRGHSSVWPCPGHLHVDSGLYISEQWEDWECPLPLNKCN